MLRNRETVQRLVAEAASPWAPTLGLALIAEEFIDELSAALASASYLPLLSWIDEARVRYAGVPHLQSMFAGVCREAISTVRELEGTPATLVAQISSLEHVLHTLSVESRRNAASSDAAGLGAVDDTDRAIDALLTAYDAEVPGARARSEAISAWCRRIAVRLSFSPEHVTFLARCGLIFDIGKMRTPVSILSAARELGVAEWEEVRQHANAGEEIVRAIDALQQFAPVIRSHHERLDGRGYPHGLAGSEIPMAARIVAVADAFDAMISRRPYRPVLMPLEALEHLRRERGTRFDPIVVEAMVEVVHDIDRT